jgi:HlyD family secretion protein
MNKQRWIWILVIVVVVIAISVTMWRGERTADDTPRGTPAYLTQSVDRGDVKRTVNATGSLSPVNLVQVGSSVSGTVRRLHADFNSAVRRGQLLAELDTVALDAELAQAQAQQRSAASSLALARTRLIRSRSLLEQGFVARSEVDEAEANERAALATEQQMQAGVDRALNNRQLAEIRSPVDGTVVSREVSVGQTVAASLQTPVLFKIAQDLREMQIDMNVSEADVGLMREGQAVTFTVDAFVDRVYSGEVAQIRNNHTVQQNVVTYTVVVRSRNDDLSLRPGMTGYVAVGVAEARGVLRLPNSALRYEPASVAGPGSGTVLPGTATARSGSEGPSNQRVLWRLQPGRAAEAVRVTLGIADARHTQLLAGDLKEGDQLVIGEPANAGFTGPRLF